MDSNDDRQTQLQSWLHRASPTGFAAYCIVAAFTTYFCMYAFRKPFNAGTYENVQLWGIAYKTILIAAQVTGYTISKFIGIKVISEMPPARRAVSILVLIAVAEGALLLFAIVPPPVNFLLLFVNGIPLGMVFGLVLSFLEGRQMTEALSAGLCASFILASGFVKSVGRSLIEYGGVNEYWMPFVTGLIFVVPLLIGVFLLSQIPQPSATDVASRSQRMPMDGRQRWEFFRRHAFGLSGLVMIYILLTIIRSFRDDFAVEIWNDLGHENEPSVYTYSEIAVMFGVVAINGSAVLIRSNRTALIGSLGLLMGGFVLILLSLWGHHQTMLGPFAFMVLIGLGMYVPYVAFHTTLFERLIAAFREKGNIGYLMYLADAIGYLGYVGVLISKNLLPDDVNYLQLFVTTTLWMSIAAMVIVALVITHYVRSVPRRAVSEIAPHAASEIA